MSETVKLIIEIPKEDMEFICKTSFVEDERTMYKQSSSDRQRTMMLFRLMDSVKDGIPLDDVLAEIREEIKALDEGITSYEHDNPWVYKYEVLEILDNIGKRDSEC